MLVSTSAGSFCIFPFLHTALFSLFFCVESLYVPLWHNNVLAETSHFLHSVTNNYSFCTWSGTRLYAQPLERRTVSFSQRCLGSNYFIDMFKPTCHISLAACLTLPRPRPRAYHFFCWWICQTGLVFAFGSNSHGQVRLFLHFFCFLCFTLLINLSNFCGF